MPHKYRIYNVWHSVYRLSLCVKWFLCVAASQLCFCPYIHNICCMFYCCIKCNVCQTYANVNSAWLNIRFTHTHTATTKFSVYMFYMWHTFSLRRFLQKTTTKVSKHHAFGLCFKLSEFVCVCGFSWCVTWVRKVWRGLVLTLHWNNSKRRCICVDQDRKGRK